MNRKPKILVFEFHQETNTFNPILTAAPRFQSQCVFEGEELFQGVVRSKGMTSGAVNAIWEAGGEVIPTVFMHAPSGGRVEDAVFDYLADKLKQYIAEAEELDGVMACLHGATCCESHDDACGEILELLRQLVGDKPIAAAFDLHANITEKMLKNADIICGYNTYPHVDYYTTGARAAKLLMERLEGQRYPMAACRVDVLAPPAGYTDLNGPFKEIIDAGKEMVATGKLLDFTVFPVQPWLDVPEITSRIVTIGKDGEMAKECAQILAEMWLKIRDEVQVDLADVDEVIRIAEENKTEKPVLLSYSADSPNGGCVGDSPYIALRLQALNSKIRSCMFVVDPEAVKQAYALGVGGTGTFRVGACFSKDMPGPFVAEGTVRSLHDGYFPTYKYTQAYLGASAVVSFGSMDILLCNQGASTGSPMIFRHFGIEPAFYDLVVIKANTSFRVPYAPISDLIYVADAPGAGAANLKRFQWHRLPKGLYPFDLPENYQVPQAELY